MDGKRTARETMEQILRATVEGTRDDIAAFYHPDVEIELPFQAEGGPVVMKGREGMRERMNASARFIRFDAVEHATVHETADPEVVIAEYTIRGAVIAKDLPFSLAYITVTRVVDGLVVTSRDYTNPAALAGVMASLAE